MVQKADDGPIVIVQKGKYWNQINDHRLSIYHRNNILRIVRILSLKSMSFCSARGLRHSELWWISPGWQIMQQQRTCDYEGDKCPSRAPVYSRIAAGIVWLCHYREYLYTIKWCHCVLFFLFSAYLRLESYQLDRESLPGNTGAAVEVYTWVRSFRRFCETPEVCLN
jgi:hypothetical protein